MSKPYKVVASVVVTLVILVSPLAVYMNVSKVTAQSGGWESSADPAIQKTVNLSVNTLPTRGNIDCTPTAYINTNSGQSVLSSVGCFASSPIGRMDINGGAILDDAINGIPITNLSTSMYGLDPLPNQSLILSQSSAP